ncbi:MAG: NusA-like transcription termination signal-binding factor [Thaumarchaeota archaeon]|nr:NusA-like transcription termination signal-binding factor [Nitrososphaerota archaeon]
MPENIKLTSQELELIQIFQRNSGSTPRDCIIDDAMNRIIFVINKGEMGLAIGKGGQSIKNVQKYVGRPVELVEHSDDPKEFIKNSLDPKLVSEVRITDKLDGKKVATVVVDEKKKGALVGRGGRNAERARLLAKRYFAIVNVHIVHQ